MLEKIIQFSIKQKIIIYLLTGVLLVAGVYSYTQLPIEAFPDVLPPSVQVITQVAGLSAEDIEKKVTIPLEREFSGIPRLAGSRSISEFGLSVVYLTFDSGVDNYWARTQVTERIATASLPPGVIPSLAALASVTGEILRYELKGEGLSLTELRTIQDWTLEKQWRSVPGVADVVGYGGLVRTWDVLVDPTRLSAYNITSRQIADAINNSNSSAGGNLIDWPNQSFVVRLDGQYKSKDEVESVGIVQKGNGIIRVKDVAQVVESHAPIRGVVGRDTHDNIVQGIVLLRKGENPVLVGEGLKDKLEELKKSTILPEGVRLEVYYDRLNLVEKTTRTVGHNLFEGFLLVCLILYIFLRNKYATALVALVVPLSLCYAFLMILLTETPANLISLGAIDFGIIVDGAVIVVEFVLAYIEDKSRSAKLSIADVQANIHTVISGIVRPVFVSMLLIIVAYIPIFTLRSVEGKMFTPLAMTISFALTGALLLSLTFVPSLIPRVIEEAIRHPHTDPAWFVRLRAKYDRLLNRMLAQPKKAYIIMVSLLTVGVLSLALSGTEFLPELDEGALWIRASFPHSMSLEEGIKVAAEVRNELNTLDEVTTTVSQLGGPEDGTDPNLFDNCEFFVDLKSKEEWKHFHHNREELIHHVRQMLAKFPGVEFNVSQPIADNVEEAIAGVKGKNVAKIYGPDVEGLYSIGNQILGQLKQIKGLTDIALVAGIPRIPSLVVKLDRAKVAQAGLTSQDVNDLVEIAVGGKVTTQIYDNEAKVDVVVRAGEKFRKNLESIKSLPLPLPNGGRIRLDQVASVGLVDSPQTISRESGYRRIGVKFNVEDRDLGSAMKDIFEKTKDLKMPPGYFIKWGGEYENQSRAMHRLLVVIPMTFALLGVLLFLLYGDFYVVGIVLSTLIVSVSGSAFLLFARGIPFSVSSAVGLLALFGVVALEDITLCSTFLKELRANQEADIFATIKLVCLQRFRPIIMTTSLAALGMLPTAISSGIGSETQRPIATAVIGGLISALPTVLVILPVTLLLVFTWRKATGRLLIEDMTGIE